MLNMALNQTAIATNGIRVKVRNQSYGMENPTVHLLLLYHAAAILFSSHFTNENQTEAGSENWSGSIFNQYKS